MFNDCIFDVRKRKEKQKIYLVAFEYDDCKMTEFHVFIYE